MRFRYVLVSAAAVLLLGASPASGAGIGSFALTATSPHPSTGYAPTFTGNGRLGIRVPAIGQGYVGGTVPSQAELAGFYAKPTHPLNASESVQQRASIPDWSALTFKDGGTAFSLSRGKVTAWRQTVDLHTGIITTTATWRAPDGHVTRLRYQVLTDRADQWLGVVSLTLSPQWSGSATVTDLIDGSKQALSGGTAPSLTEPGQRGHDVGSRQDWVSVRTQTSGIRATLASELRTSANVAGRLSPVSEPSGSVAQRLTFPVKAGQNYTVTKYIGVGDSQDAKNTTAAARHTAGAAAKSGYGGLVAANDRAWDRLWSGRVDILGDSSLATDVNASEFYLWSNTRDGVNWSISPAGLSSNGYDGHIFWDAETWMYPSLLAQHSELAKGIDAYRLARLQEAEHHARATGYKGARFPWESALDGTEQIPPPASINSEGLYEQHITADIALAQWQYYLATGDKGWLAHNGWPVISHAAEFWASRATAGAGGRYHIDHVTGPDEENPNVNDEAYTNNAAATVLRDATAAAGVLGRPAPAAWLRIGRGLVLRKATQPPHHPEFDGYQGQMVKQADVTMLQYPWGRSMPAGLARGDLNYYVPRTDPNGPSMSDAINSIDTSTLRTPGCASYVYTVRSFQPFIRDVFRQFSETSTGGAFTFMTGIGGFLQEFLYGYSGMRLAPSAVRLAPTLTGAIGGIVLHHVGWHGRTFTVTIGRRRTTVSLNAGRPMPVDTPNGRRVLSSGATLSMRTAQPQAAPTSDLVRCGPARASSAALGAPALAAIDGSIATDWQPTRLPATLTVPTRRRASIRQVVVVWGRQWRPPPKPNVKPPPRPVVIRRASRYLVQTSNDGRSWRTLATVTRSTGTTDTLRVRSGPVRFVRLRILAAAHPKRPLLQELTVR
ncbi:MAG TPA: glycosyl hydrolase family 65 protein [Solirubrobacteraceae bacterium]|nr:glycosyl hydrolase family 65 protein [Solirubrobacteraceae bacterium]